MNDASRQAGGKKPPADRLSREQQKELERVDALLQTRYMADLGPATEGWGRRQFLFLSVLGTSFAGINFFVWPFVHSMNPAADVAALATTDVDVEAIEPGQSITVV